jgi:acetyl esterase/lipase
LPAWPTNRCCWICTSSRIWVHGGAWRAGSRYPVPIAALVDEGFAVASVDYRLSTVARFPAQVQDIKAAIRFLRARAADYHLDPDRIFIAGSSAGGHLAALVGVTNDVPALEGEVGEHLGTSSDVQAIVSLYGAANLQSILDQSTEYGLSVRVPALQLLLGCQPAEQPELARLASPVAHVDAADPPLLLIHGDRDPQMPLQQSQELCDAYRQHKLPVSFHKVAGGVHGGPEFYDAAMLARIRTFLQAGQRRNAGEPAQ